MERNGKEQKDEAQEEKIHCPAVAFVGGGFLSGGCGAPKEAAKGGETRTITDARGWTTALPKEKPRRVLTCATALDEITLGLVPPERMIAANKEFFLKRRSNLALVVAKIPNKIVRDPSVETVAALKPDLVFAHTWIAEEKVRAFSDLGIPVVTVKTSHSYEDVKDNIRLMALALGEEEKGEKLLALMEEKLSALTARIAAEPPEKRGKSIAFVSVMPGYGGAGCVFDDVCRYAGAKNAKALAGNVNGKPMTKEQFVAADPDFIFLPTYNDPESSEDKYGADYLSDPSLAVMRAVKDNRVCHPFARYVYNQSQNFVLGVAETAYWLYGDDYKLPRDIFLTVAEKGN